MAAHLAQIERVNPAVNAIVTLVAEQALASAHGAADEALARRRGGRAAARPADRAQGPAADQRHPHHLRLADLPDYVPDRSMR